MNLDFNPIIRKKDLLTGVSRDDDAGGAHILYKHQQRTFQICITEHCALNDPLQIVTPFSKCFDQRLLSARELLQVVFDKRAIKKPSPRSGTLRLHKALMALDALSANATYREIAEVIYGAKRVSAEHWKTSPLQKSVIRLCRTGEAMMRGKYSKLLMG